MILQIQITQVRIGEHRKGAGLSAPIANTKGTTHIMEYIQSLYPFAEISILGDLNVHHQLWLTSPLTDHPGELAFNFAIFHHLEQLVQHPTRHGDMPNILDISSPLILLLMLLPYLLRWAPPITISFLYLALFLQSLLRIPQSGGASCALPLPEGGI
ncbi:hypothetical protein E2C01_003510 [Portunus trituberculatus]|uniref:Endonuclease/exonuclease/phosphatase domain-containing protein n=1 Tax=Portunus trituberculatus TaxID=210409 RepID=A0A5B7CML5_PORTR|nr:hypothetical protein [Portunus trituberculatus]